MLVQNEDTGINVMVNTNIAEDEQINEAINEISNQRIGILILKDKIVINNEQMTKPYVYLYSDLVEQYNINKIDKQEVLDLLSPNTIKPILFTIFGTLLIYFFVIAYLPSTLIDIIILSVFGYIVSLIARIRLKYSAIYNIATYSLTLPILLNIIYFVVNQLTGFTIRYFEVMYNTVASIYIIAVILMIRSDIIKSQIELTKIIEEQDKVRLELQKREEEQKKQEEKENEKRKEEKKRKKEKKNQKEIMCK